MFSKEGALFVVVVLAILVVAAYATGYAGVILP